MGMGPVRYLLLFLLESPTANPTINATKKARTTTKMMQILFKPPLPAIYLLSRRSSNFSPLGPITLSKV